MQWQRCVRIDLSNWWLVCLIMVACRSGADLYGVANWKSGVAGGLLCNIVMALSRSCEAAV